MWPPFLGYTRYAIRIAPVLLPVAAAIMAITGLSLSLQSFPHGDNVLFVGLALVMSGILPISVVIGTGLLVADIALPRLRQLWIALLIVMTIGISWLSMIYGRGLDF